MSRLVPMEEAARMLGVSIDRLTEMRANNEIFGYRDGTNWKFKLSELERVADEMGVALGGGSAASDEPLDEEAGGFQVSDSAQDMLLDDLSDASEFSGLDFGDELDNSSAGSRKLRAEDQYTESESVELMEDSSAEVFKTGSASDIHDEPESIELELADSGRLAGKSGGKDKFRTQGDIVPSDANVTDDDEQLSFGNSSIRAWRPKAVASSQVMKTCWMNPSTKEKAPRTPAGCWATTTTICSAMIFLLSTAVGVQTASN